MTSQASPPSRPTTPATPTTWSSRGAAALTDRDADLPLRFEGATRLVPLVVCGGFVASTVLLLLVGPLDWHLVAPARVFVFLGCALAALVAGYLAATLRRDRTDRGEGIRTRREPPSASALVVLGSLVYLVLYVPTVQTTTASWFPNVWQGLTDAGTAYANNKYHNKTGSELALYLRMLVAPLTMLILPVTLYLWPRLSKVARVLGVVCIVASVALTIAQGVNRGVAELCANIILFLVLVAAAAISHREFRKVLKAVVGIVLVGALFAGYYGATISDRIAADAERNGRDGLTEEERDAELRRIAQIGRATERPDSVYFAVVPGPAQAVGVIFTSYVTHGYKGLDLAMEQPFRPTWGLGFSEFGRHNLLRLVGQAELEDDVVGRTYAGQIDDTWPVGQLWATFFIHPASDIGFPGTVVLMLLIGFVFGLSWRDTLVRRDPLACGVFFHLCILVIYLPANNQLYQGGELAIGFTVLLVVWLLARRRRGPATAP